MPIKIAAHIAALAEAMRIFKREQEEGAVLHLVQLFLIISVADSATAMTEFRDTSYRADWFDPRNGTWQPVGKGSLQSNEIGIIMLPQFQADNDWDLRLTYTGPIPAAERRIPDEY
jgi:hypothetical protein